MKVSIIVPVYNMEDKISRCLDSLINQTYKNIEIIVVNDGSTDNSLSIIKKYAQKDSRITLINQKNKGISAARNIALKKATGDYITFVDSDDFACLNMIEKLIKGVKGYDICVCNYYNYYDDCTQEKYYVGYKELFGGSLYDHPAMIRDIDYAPWNKIYKKELFDDIEFPIDTKYEDLEAILKVFSKAKKINKIEDFLYNYYINMNGETRKQTLKNMDILKIAKNLNNYFKFEDSLLKDYFFEKMSQRLLLSCSTLFKIVDRKTCINYMREVYDFLDNNHKGWKKLYMQNNIDTKYLKFIRGNKILFITYAYLRTTLYKIIGR